jgi:universal stress protein A
MTRIHQILFATDFSKASGKAFTTAVAMAKANHATLTVLHVIVPFTPIAPEQYINTQTWEQIDRQARRWSVEQLRKLTARGAKAGVRVVSILREGEPAREIVRAARAKRADFLIVGTHGRTGLARFFVGSVASRLVATAPCPLVTVRGK